MSKPKPSPTIYILSFVLLGGFVALFLSANHAFSMVATNQAQAVFSALLIEAGMIADAITIYKASSWKYKIPAIFGLAASLTVSGTYNYLSAAKIGAANGVVNSWQLATLAVGPLSALLFLALQVGAELSVYEARVTEWVVSQEQAVQKERRAQIDALEETEKIRAESLAEQEHIKAAALEEAERIQMQTQIELHKLDLANLARQERNERRRAERAESKLQPVSKIATFSETLSTPEKVLQYFSANPESSNSAAARAIGTSHTTVANVLKRLEATGKIHRNGKVMVIEQ